MNEYQIIESDDPEEFSKMCTEAEEDLWTSSSELCVITYPDEESKYTVIKYIQQWVK